MRRPDKGVARFAAWIFAAVAAILGLYFVQLVAFFGLLNGTLDDTFGTSFPAVPFVALLAVLFLLRWNDLHGVLTGEGELSTKPLTRLAGAAVALAPLTFLQYSAGSLALSAVTLIMAFYGTALVVNPRSARLIFPYAALYIGGVTAPGAIQYAFGEPLAGLASSLSAGMVGVTGIPVSWSGTQFELVSRGGASVVGVVTPGCSSVLSVTTFLGLLGLMYFDMRKDGFSTLKLAVVGTAALVVLNSVRIWILIFAAYTGGPDAIWGLHNWIGYAIFLGFYLAVLAVYSRMRGAQPATAGTTSLPQGTGWRASSP